MVQLNQMGATKCFLVLLYKEEVNLFFGGRITICAQFLFAVQIVILHTLYANTQDICINFLNTRTHQSTNF